MRLDNADDRQKLAYMAAGLLAVPWLAAEYPKRMQVAADSIMLIQQSARAALIALHDQVQRSVTGAFENGQMSSLIESAFTRAYRLGKYGAGSIEPLSAEDIGEVEGLWRAEEKFANRLAEDVAAGKVSDARRAQRLEMYAHGLREVWHKGWIKYNPSPFFHWHMHQGAEHCVACITVSGGSGKGLPPGVYRREELPFLPGRSPICLTNCMCWLQAADGDVGAPQIREPANSGVNPDKEQS
jgi:hypothetical protein